MENQQLKCSNETLNLYETFTLGISFHFFFGIEKVSIFLTNHMVSFYFEGHCSFTRNWKLCLFLYYENMASNGCTIEAPRIIRNPEREQNSTHWSSQFESTGTNAAELWAQNGCTRDVSFFSSHHFNVIYLPFHHSPVKALPHEPKNYPWEGFSPKQVEKLGSDGLSSQWGWEGGKKAVRLTHGIACLNVENARARLCSMAPCHWRNRRHGNQVAVNPASLTPLPWWRLGRI